MLLVLSNSKDQTADYLCEKIEEESIKYVRIDTDKIANKASLFSLTYDDNGPRIIIGKQTIRPQDINIIWYRRPEPIKIEFSETDSSITKFIAGEWAAAIDGFLSHIPQKLWVNYPSNCMIASYKPEQLSRAKSFGLSVPKTLITLNYEEANAFFQKCNSKIIAKPLCSGYIERKSPEIDSVIYTNVVNEITLDDVSVFHNCPTFFQEMVPKIFDVRIIILDYHLHAVKMSTEGKESSIDIRYNNMDNVVYSNIRIPNNVKKSLVSLIKSYGLRFAAIDMAVTEDNKWFFFEINPNGQWAWLDIVGEAKIHKMFIDVFRKSMDA